MELLFWRWAGKFLYEFLDDTIQDRSNVLNLKIISLAPCFSPFNLSGI